MENIGIRGLALKMFTDYLSGRTQRVKINSLVSEDECICFGVPQGSILGPTLFLIYINDLCKMSIPNCDIFTYADDTALIVYDVTWDKAKQRTEHSLRLVMEWLSANLLTLNIEKTKLLRFSLPNSNPLPTDSSVVKAHSCSEHDISCCCLTLSLVSSIKYLGVYIDEKLTWRAHIEALCTRTRKLIYIFKELRHSADPATLLLVYQSLCASIITYCITVWGGTYKSLLIQIERAQRAILKVMHFKRRDYPTALLYSETQVLTVRQLFILRVVLRRHSTLPLDSNILLRRRGRPVCDSVQCRSAFASRHYVVLSARLYNRVHRSIDIYALTKFTLKAKLTNWLQNLSYEYTENILTITS